MPWNTSRVTSRVATGCSQRSMTVALYPVQRVASFRHILRRAKPRCTNGRTNVPPLIQNYYRIIKILLINYYKFFCNEKRAKFYILLSVKIAWIYQKVLQCSSTKTKIILIFILKGFLFVYELHFWGEKIQFVKGTRFYRRPLMLYLPRSATSPAITDTDAFLRSSLSDRTCRKARF